MMNIKNLIEMALINDTQDQAKILEVDIDGLGSILGQ